MASESLATLHSISNGMPLIAGGAVAFGVAALVLSFVRRTKKKLTRRGELGAPDSKRKAWRQELGDDLKNVWATGRRRDKRKETYVNPIDVWAPSDMERGLERIPGPPSILEMDEMDDVQAAEIAKVELLQDRAEEMDLIPTDVVVKLDSQEDAAEDMDLSPISSAGPSIAGGLVCTYPGCKFLEPFPNRGALTHHARYHTKTNFCPSCDKSFAVPKDLKRHIVSKHTPKNAKKLWYCTVHGCKHAKLSIPRTGIDRKDNWQRHMRLSHGKSNRELAALEGVALDDA